MREHQEARRRGGDRRAGADIATITPKVLRQMVFHPKTEETIKEFDDAWKEFVTKNKLVLPART